MLRTQIQLKNEQAQLLRKMAQEKHISIAELIRRGMDMYLNKFQTHNLSTLRERAINAAGCFHSKKSDISRNHDAYLDEAFHQ